ncbi:MAG TPA: hypothetical protein VG710_07685, partial [Opitutus sp.]|nr:hypothetical protein [Opitutus sp.]
MKNWIRAAAAVAFVVGASLPAATPARAASGSGHWVGAWVSSQQVTEHRNLPPAPGLAGRTLREVIQPTLSGNRLRVTLSNVFGNGPVKISAAHIARSAGESAIEAGSDATLTFNGAGAVTIEAGASMISDPVAFDVAAFKNLAVTLAVESVPEHLTGHPGSRMTSFIQPGADVTAASFA